jgi:hypothetical protein
MKKTGAWRKEEQKNDWKEDWKRGIEERRAGKEWERIMGKEREGKGKRKRKGTRKNRKRMEGGGGVPKGNKPECVILFHNGTSLLRNGKIKSLIHSLSPERMSNTLHFLCYFQIVFDGSLVLKVFLINVILQLIWNFKIRFPIKLEELTYSQF